MHSSRFPVRALTFFMTAISRMMAAMGDMSSHEAREGAAWRQHHRGTRDGVKGQDMQHCSRSPPSDPYLPLLPHPEFLTPT